VETDFLFIVTMSLTFGSEKQSQASILDKEALYEIRVSLGNSS